MRNSLAVTLWALRILAVFMMALWLQSSEADAIDLSTHFDLSPHIVPLENGNERALFLTAGGVLLLAGTVKRRRLGD